MSKYGIKIRNISAGTLYENNLGVRDFYSSKPAMLTNSLFNDFLVENGLKVSKSGSTRDIVCIDFDFGSRSFDEEIGHVDKLIASYTEEENEEMIDVMNKVKERAYANKDKYCKKSKEEIRTEFYKNGVDITYVTKNKDGEITKKEIIHYEMLFRSTGKAKHGSCMFIKKSLFKKTQKFLRMGIKLNKHNAPIVEIGAYSPLIASGICDGELGRVRIEPENILVIKDVDSFFETKVISVETDENKQCIAKKYNKYKLKNTLFDGQALIDESIFPEWGEGYVLLRHHFCKMAAFKTKVQEFFKDFYGDAYEYAVIEDMFGNEHLVSDIKLITTENAMKWIKFDISYEYWCEWVHKNDCMFGIVKTAHKSKLGNVQRMSYQMVNALDESVMNSVAQCSKEYIELMKKDDNVFLDYLRKNANFANDYEPLVALCEQDMTFTRSEYFRDRKKEIIRNYVLNFKGGKINQNADNLVIVGSPYAMLLHAIGVDVEEDPTFKQEEGTIQCYTSRFEDDKYLAFFRSPFNSKNNMSYLHNVYHPYFDKYFDFGELIIAVNMQHTDFQDRNNGSDQDSDSGYTTDQQDIVELARRYYLEYPTIVNNIPKEKNVYDNTPEDFAKVDNNLASASLAIGESSNLAQLALTYSYNFDDENINDYVCILSVLAQVAIDNAKRRFDIDLTSEIKRIKKDMDINTKGLPLFWDIVKKDVNKSRINKNLKCPMNCLSEIKIDKFHSKDATLPMSYFFAKEKTNRNLIYKNKKVESIIEKYSINLYSYDVEDSDDEYLLLKDDFDEMVKEISSIHISKNYKQLFSWLLDRAFNITPNIPICKTKTKIYKNKALLLKTLYSINKEVLLSVFKNE